MVKSPRARLGQWRTEAGAGARGVVVVVVVVVAVEVEAVDGRLL